MTDKQKQIKNSFIYMTPIAVGAVLPLIVVPILTRLLTLEDFGVLALAQVYAIFAAGLAHFGMTAAYERNFFDYRGDALKTAQLFYSCLVFVLINFLVLAAFTFAFKSVLARWIIGNPASGNILFWAFASQLLQSVSIYFLTYYKNTENAAVHSGVSIAQAVLQHAFSIILVAGFHMGIMGVVVGQLISGLAVLLTLSILFVGKYPPSLNRFVFFDAFKVAYPLTPRIFLGVISTQFDKYMIGLLSTVGAVGIYDIGQRFGRGVFTFMTAVGNVFSPRVYRLMFELKESGGETIGRYITPFAYTCIAMAMAAALFAEEIIYILTPPSFHEAGLVVSVLVMYYGFQFFGKVNGIQLIFKKKTHITSLLTIIGLALNVGLNIPFIMKWGVMGAAWATLIASLITQSVSFAIAQHHYPILWERKAIISIFGLFAFGALLVVAMHTFGVSYAYKLAAKVCVSGAFLYLGWRLNVLTRANLSSVIQVLVPRKAVAAKG